MIQAALSRKGFTIVELLIVIVVIGILAAITIVAYNGVQNKANNTARISAISQVVKLVKAYQANSDTYPMSSGACATVDNACTNSSGVANGGNNPALMTELRKIGTPPSGVPKGTGNVYGIQYLWEPTGMINGSPAPVRLEYWLAGSNTSCGVPVSTPGDITIATTSTTGYTTSGGGITTCWVRL